MKKILFFQTAFLGDLLLAIPCLKNLRRLYPESEIHLYCRKACGKVFLETKLVDQVFEVDKSDKSTRSAAWKQLRQNQYDLVVTPHPSFRSAWMTFKLGAKKTLGFKSFWGNLLYKQSVKKDLSLPDSLRQLQLIAELIRIEIKH